jgi:hypothetical protein
MVGLNRAASLPPIQTEASRVAPDVKGTIAPSFMRVVDRFKANPGVAVEVHGTPP